jgi:hypothetical protein
MSVTIKLVGDVLIPKTLTLLHVSEGKLLIDREDSTYEARCTDR